MLSSQHFRKPIIVTLTVSVLVLLLVFGAQYALARRADPSAGSQSTPNSPTGWGDDSKMEVNVEWINQYPGQQPGTQFNLSYNDDSCDGLYNRLINRGWSSNLHYTDLDVWEIDAKDEARGGSEDNLIDNADIAMICASSTLALDPFWQKNLWALYYSSTHEDRYLSPSDAGNAYGDSDLEWLAFDSSSLLGDYPFSGGHYNSDYWAGSMNGLHLLLGFTNTRYLNSAGDGLLWGLYMTGTPYLTPYPVAAAWFKTVDWLQPAGVCARALYEYWNYLGDHLWGKGTVYADPPTSNYYYFWEHCSTGGVTKQWLNSNKQPEVTSMPVLQVTNRVVNANYVQNTIAPAFNLSGEIGMDDMFYYMSDTTNSITHTLMVDRVTGSYSFDNLSKLWSGFTVTPTLPSELEAAAKINNWFSTTPAEGLPAMQYRNPTIYEYSTEDIVERMKTQMGISNLPQQEISRTPMDVSMTYPRSISLDAGTASGTQQVDFPIVGPGGRLKVYLGDMGEIIGVQGGSRDVQVMSRQVNVLDASKAWEAFLADPSLAIPEVPWVADYITYTAVPILAYYEMPYFQPQDQLIPVWDFNADFYSDGNLLAEDVQVYVPAALEYLPPQVAILNPSDGSTFWAGEPISFEGWINHGTPPYTIEWTSSSDGYLGNTMNVVSALGSEIKGGTVFNPTVSLQVTDANGLSSTATISLKIKPIFWLPFINR